MATLLTLILTLAAAQDADKRPIDQKKIDEAIDRGTAWLKQQIETDRYQKQEYLHHHGASKDFPYDELIAYTLLHGGASPEDPAFQKLIRKIVDAPLKKTYNVSLQALLLQKLDARKYAYRLAQCGQFLIDNQCKNGQWGYGEPVDLTHLPIPTEANGTMPKITLRQRRWGGEMGCNSNTQYALLGLRAVIDSGITVPQDTLRKARTWLEFAQNHDGSFGYKAKQAGSGAMTAGGLAALAICKFYLKEDLSRDKHIKNAAKWLGEHFNVTNNPKGGIQEKQCYYYYLYALERAGDLAQQETFGKYHWYSHGAEHLVATQQQDGHWPALDRDNKMLECPLEATCFAILFLKRATTSLATGK